uniref:Uncharacterized protein n=1 Tax=Candidatus Kentrum sp. TC TaxID=2126339 RepID=A0A450Z0L8_9GAMM|nr:MAG: hypothetical protein BECKTC1821E_GA0114239_10839 [Candidatus Kentron sp. TC]VFK49960.1 MAG: hypothetical protein BECKTC1821D_GA0114238_108511 [Candidatus Kentron sp. TC]VFK62073.1 MAG: hypothetical protein BECKTC1821F_GA0114240_106812 [Candidatus Kentron sp. TC]
MAKSDPYENIIEVISVNILYFDLRHGRDDELLLDEKQQRFFMLDCFRVPHYSEGYHQHTVSICPTVW